MGRANYPFEIRNRQRIEEIVKELDGDIPQGLASEIAAIDSRLSGMRMGPEFVWDAVLAQRLPAEAVLVPLRTRLRPCAETPMAARHNAG